MAGALGFEPRVTVPKTVALPLGDAPIHKQTLAKLSENSTILFELYDLNDF